MFFPGVVRAIHVTKQALYEIFEQFLMTNRQPNCRDCTILTKVRKIRQQTQMLEPPVLSILQKHHPVRVTIGGFHLMITRSLWILCTD